jgi:GNAT superfamily N-acetyltransferase
LSDFARPRPITVDDDWSAFRCGEPTLDDWIQLRALKNERVGASRTFVTIERGAGVIAGYYCLSASSLTHEAATSALRRNTPDPIPVILIGRLAVDKKFAGTGLGASLLQDAMSKEIEAARTIGARAFIVHALNDSAESFYRKFGFTLVPESARVMYILVQDAEATVAGSFT